MKHQFVTLFNQKYLTRGLALYHSLKKHCVDAYLTIICFDDKTYQTLTQLNLPDLNCVPLSDFETDALRAVKPTRSVGEYCWTCTPFSIAHVLSLPGVEACTYVDADLYFFSSPLPLIEEIGNKAVLISPHRYTPQYDQSEKSGIYCVQFMRFTNTEAGWIALNWWKEACLDWCYNRFEAGKFGDQKYLDDWPTRFESVHVLEHLGGGLAPWNIQQYHLEVRDGHLMGVESSTKKTFEAIFYHFHQCHFLGDNRVDYGLYRLSEQIKRFIYRPYVKEVETLAHQLAYAHSEAQLSGWQSFISQIKRRIKGIYNQESFLSHGTSI